jgi:type IV secretory pathway VirB2 component (pilin)
MKLSIIRKYARVVRILMLVVAIFNLVTPAFADFPDTFDPFVEKVMLIMKTIAVIFVAYAGICTLNGNPMLIQPAIIGLILIFGADLIVDFIDGIFGN